MEISIFEKLNEMGYVCKPQPNASLGQMCARSKAVVGTHAPAYRSKRNGNADWTILVIRGLKKGLGHDYRKLMDVRREMPRISKVLVVPAETRPNVSTEPAKKQEISMRLWRTMRDISVGTITKTSKLSTGGDQIQISQHSANRTKKTIRSVEETAPDRL